MRFISRKTHAVLDYIVGLLLIAAPWIFRFSDVEAARWCAIVVGLLVIAMSLVTDYEGGTKKMISMATHLNMDVLVGIFLALSPWLFGFREQVYLPHLVVGIFSILAGLCTVRSSQHSNLSGMGMGHAH
ncbi:SPW repeat protein [Pedobacter sp.]|uniref:SPW repeat protein n=1 Tax=Pedobacter sp. TaxID=1411316 RepID=UPI003D7F970F